jgi:translation initiation factor 1 (eIF-1/SUI1)
VTRADLIRLASGSPDREILVRMLLKLESLTRTVNTVKQQGEEMANNVDQAITDVTQRLNDLKADVAASAALKDNTIAFIQGQSAKIATLTEQNAAQKKQIDDLIANGGLNQGQIDALKVVLTGIDEQNALLDGQRAAVAAALEANQQT